MYIMDIFKRELAPITEAAWEQIETEAKNTLHANLSARKFVDVKGPFGLSYPAHTTGKLSVPKKQDKAAVRYGVHQVMPLTESRISFELDVWELDNANRGASDIELTPLREAARAIAKFEENAIYGGFSEANLKGITGSVEFPVIKLSSDKSALLESVSKGITVLREASIEGPYALVASPAIWKAFTSYSNGYPLNKHLEKILGGEIIYSPFIDDAYLVSLRGGDMDLILGSDFSIGYESHDSEKVKLFISESFTFMIYEPQVFVRFTM
jgi:uncharacterized linocin/CFP29 family protein